MTGKHYKAAKQGPGVRAQAFEATDRLLCLLENLGIRSATLERVPEEKLDEFINATEHLWRRDAGRRTNENQKK